jgi:uncharacterized protein (DUF305 family)
LYNRGYPKAMSSPLGVVGSGTEHNKQSFLNAMNIFFISFFLPHHQIFFHMAN